MKSRELIVWILLVVAFFLLLHTCNNPQTTVITGKTDTIIHTDTVIIAHESKPRIVKTYVYMQNDSEIYINKCDSVREYMDTVTEGKITASVYSVVRGELINQKLQIKAVLNDTSFSRVDTLVKKIPLVFSLSGVAYGDLYNGPGIGASIDYKRFRVGYGYFPFKNTHQINVGYRLFGF